MATDTMTLSPLTRTRWGKVVLQLDGVACFVSGLVCALDGSWLADLTGLPGMTIVLVGIFLIVYGAALFLGVRSRDQVARPLIVVALINLAWVLASLAVLEFDYANLTAAGRWIVGLQALLVADLAVIEFILSHRAT